MKYTTSRLGACTIICFREIAFNMIGGIRLAVTHVLFALPEKFPTTGAISVTCGWSMLVLFLGFSYMCIPRWLPGELKLPVMDIAGSTVILLHFGHITMVSLLIVQKNKSTIAIHKCDIHVILLALSARPGLIPHSHKVSYIAYIAVKVHVHYFKYHVSSN